ncbi:hypothetical protein D3C80_1904650 [compost metagenome]
MYAAGQRQALIVQRVAFECLPEEIVGDAEVVIGFIHRHVMITGLALITHLFTRQLGAVFGIKNIADDFATGRGFRPGGA